MCRGLAWSPCADTLAIIDGSDEVRVLDEGGRLLAARSFPMGALGLACSPRGDELAVACVDQLVRLWNPKTGAERTLVGHAAHVYAVAFHPDGTRLASGSQDRTVKIWDLQAGVEVLTLPHAQSVCAVEWSRDGRRLASATRAVS